MLIVKSPFPNGASLVMRRNVEISGGLILSYLADEFQDKVIEVLFLIWLVSILLFRQAL